VIDIARLVRSAQAGDAAAFAQLYQRFAGMVHGVVLARIARTEVTWCRTCSWPRDAGVAGLIRQPPKTRSNATMQA
jgi:hypothetical protein